MKTLLPVIITAALLPGLACRKDHHLKPGRQATFKVENILDAQTFVESGTFKGAGDPPVILPGQQVSFSFSAAKGQALSFATMYGWSSDLFFAPENPGIRLFDDAGNPLEGDVSGQIKLWDDGTRINQQPGMSNPHTAAPDPDGVVAEVNGQDAQGFSYLAASKLMKATLKYNDNSTFTLTIENISGGTANETPFSPGVWCVSNALGGSLFNSMPLYAPGHRYANGLQPLAEMGDNSTLAGWLSANTGIITPLSPVLVVVYNSKTNPLFSMGEKDRGQGLADIAQKGDPTRLQAALMKQHGVRDVYVLAAPTTGVLLPVMPESAGGSVEQVISYRPGDKIAFATMFGYSNDWFYAFPDGVDAAKTGDLSAMVKLWDDGTAVAEYPGAGIHQAAFGGDPSAKPESNPIMEVGNQFPVPAAKNVIRITLNQ